jgi:hypothetical protein
MKLFKRNHAFFATAILLICTALAISACEENAFNEGPFVSKRKSITYFAFEDFQPPVVAEINSFDSTINAIVPFGSNLSALSPTIIASDKATVSPPSKIINDFTNTATYVVNAEDGTVQNWPVNVVWGEEQAVLRLRLSRAIWNLSPTGTGIPDFFTKDGERGLAAGNNGHIYVTNNNDNIMILNASDGSPIGPLDMTDVDGGSPKIADVEFNNGVILACNSVEWTSDGGGEPTTFKVYRWDTEDSAPTVFLRYENTEYRMGDSFSVVGDINNEAVIITAFGRKFLNPATRGNQVFLWRVSGGVVNPVPEIITVQGVPSLAKFGSRPHASMFSVDAQEIIVNANDIDITQADLTGVFQARLPNTSKQLYDGFTSNFEVFEFQGKKVLITAFPRSSRESRLIVIDISKGIGNVTPEDVILSQDLMAGSGEVANVNASGGVSYNMLDANNVDLYVLITNQAVAKFRLTAELD